MSVFGLTGGVIAVAAVGLTASAAIAVGVTTDWPGGRDQDSLDSSEWIVSVAAGGGRLLPHGLGAEPGFADGDASTALFDRPVSIIVDRDGSLLVADSGNHRIRRLTGAGVIETVAGSGSPGSSDGTALEAQFRTPIGLAVASDGTIYVSDGEAATIRRIDPDGKVSTVAGVDYPSCVVDEKTEGGALPQQPYPCPAPFTPWLRDGAASEALIGGPAGIALDEAAGVLYVADSVNHCIRAVDLGAAAVSTFSGQCEPGFADGSASEAQFTGPAHLAFARNGDLLVSENGNRIRAIGHDGAVRTLVGAGVEGSEDGPNTHATLKHPAGFAVGPDGIVIADAGNQLIRVMRAGSLETLAGVGGQGFMTGPAPESQFSYPVGLAIDEHGDVFVADYNLGRILRISREDYSADR